MKDEASTGGSSTSGFDSNEIDATDSEQRPNKQHIWRRRLWRALSLILLVVAALVIPPLINLSHYQRSITALMARSVGRPVRLSSVELRLLPSPGFVLHDLSVSEDAVFGAEPVLFARTVVASFRLFSLWRGKLEISRISLDEASLNLVRNEQGRWNLESLMVGAAEPGLTGQVAGKAANSSGKPMSFPYLEATNSRVNLKRGVEKSPYSVVGTELSLWQDRPGEWRVRLRGQPVRTDMDLSLADTGELRMEANLHSAAQLRTVPIKLQMEWREAQLGQLSRMLLGSDAGWRGDMTVDVEVVGTSESAQTKARLRATGVRRAEFAPETPLDFDANCSFVYQHSRNAFHHGDCDTAIGSGHLHLTAELPGHVDGAQAQAMLQVNQVSVQAGLDLLRTVRSDFAPGISAKGVVNGSLAYDGAATRADEPKSRKFSRSKAARTTLETPALATLQGALTVDGGQLSGGGLKETILLPKMNWTPTLTQGPGGPKIGMGTRITVPLVAASREPDTPAQAISVRFVLSADGYDAAISGSAFPAKLRELAYAFGLRPADAADGFVGGMAEFDLAAKGPWIALSQPSETHPNSVPSASSDSNPVAEEGPNDPNAFTGTIELHHTQWQAPYLNRPVELPQATVILSEKSINLASDFAYGALKGTMAVTAPSHCKTSDCIPQVQLRFSTLDAEAVQTALLGTPAKQTLFSPLMDRFKPSEKLVWPAVAIGVQADGLTLGPVTLHKASAQLDFDDRRVVIQSLEAALLGGALHGSGSLSAIGGPVKYAFDGEFTKVNAVELGPLIGGHLSGEPISGSGKVSMSGATTKELTATAAGEVHFDWRHGAIAAAPVPLSRFDKWSGVFSLRDGKAQLGENELTAAGRRTVASGTIPFGGMVELAIGAPSDSAITSTPAKSDSHPAVAARK